MLHIRALWLRGNAILNSSPFHMHMSTGLAPGMQELLAKIVLKFTLHSPPPSFQQSLS